MKVVPISDNVVVKREESEETTAGGIVLPDAAQVQQSQGKVLSVGDGKLLSDGTRAEHQVTEGDRVFFGSYAGTEVEVNGETLLIMREHEILAVLK